MDDSRAKGSLIQRRVDLDDLGSMVGFVVSNGGDVTFGRDRRVLLRLGGHEWRMGGHSVDTLRQMLIYAWARVLDDADRQSNEPPVYEAFD